LVGLELLREVKWKKIIPDPRVWLAQLGSSAGQVTMHYRPSYEFHLGFLHKSFDMFQSQRSFHSNQMEDFLHMNKCPCGMLCPRCIRSQRSTTGARSHDSGSGISRTISVSPSRAQQAKSSDTISILSPVTIT
jgi:hypothetical protein